MKTKENKDNKPNWRDWAVSNPNKQDGVRPKKKTQKGKKEESEIIAEQTKDFLKRGGKIQVFEQDFAKDVPKSANGRNSFLI